MNEKKPLNTAFTKADKKVIIYAIAVTEEEMLKIKKSNKTGFNLTRNEIKYPILKSSIIYCGYFDDINPTNFQDNNIFPPTKIVQSQTIDKTTHAYWHYVLNGNRYNNKLINKEVDSIITGSYGHWASGIASPDSKSTLNSLYLSMKKPKCILVFYEYAEQ
jgi:hypothetical protein